jgi:beta-galactosidase
MVSAVKNYFVKDGKPFFLVSGEIHYFRINPEKWDLHLKALKKTGANTVSSYICWDHHEIQEGVFDLTGKTDPSRNIVRFFELCKANGLDLIVKPGPYILAEYSYNGLPGWLIKKAGSGVAKDIDGRIIGPDVFTYMSDEFLSYTYKWYDKIMPLIAKYQTTSGGPITMMQVCNEVGIFQWLSGIADVNDPVPQLYKKFLKEKYEDITKLNLVYGTDYAGFDGVTLPRFQVNNKKSFAQSYDYHVFYRKYLALYIDTLIKKIRSYGINVQLTHNIPGWIYGNASELPMLITMYSEILKDRDDIIFGLDHIPEFLSFRNAHSDLACNRFLDAMQKNAPVWSAEFQAGTREHHVRNDANDMEFFYKASLAHGMKGFNYYMFSQGKNPKGKGFFGGTFYFQTPLSADGKPSALYGAADRIGHFIAKEEKELLESKTRDHVLIGMYKPYYYTDLISSQMIKEKRLDLSGLGLTLDPRFIRENILFDGILRGLQTLNFNYRIIDLEQPSSLPGGLLWVACAEYMDAQTQTKLGKFVHDGGHLMLTPVVPVFDEYLNPCTILKDSLGLEFSRSDSDHKIDMDGIEDIFTFFPWKTVFKTNNAKPLAWTKNKEVCGITKQVGHGQVTVLGFAIGYTSDEHLMAYEKILSLENIRRDAVCTDPEIQFVLREGTKKDYLFLLNYHNQAKSFSIDGRKVRMAPFSGEILQVPKKKKH